VWTSRARITVGLPLARHDSSVPKHQGITAFGIPMHGEGVDARPLRQMNGDAHFTEVFLDDAPCRRRPHRRDR
jgi:alkylation response protein AidB-like acyl-CoA dehydrogenase